MTTQSTTKSGARSGGAKWTAYASQFGALGVLIIIGIIFAILEPAFISRVNPVSYTHLTLPTSDLV